MSRVNSRCVHLHEKHPPRLSGNKRGELLHAHLICDRGIESQFIGAVVVNHVLYRQIVRRGPFQFVTQKGDERIEINDAVNTFFANGGH